MAEKVKVSRVDAEILDYIIAKYHGDTEKAFDCVSPTMVVWNESLGMNQSLMISRMDFAKALLGVYEIEQTPEEILLAAYQNQIEWANTNDPSNKIMHQAHANGIVFTLEKLGIKIKGINE